MQAKLTERITTRVSADTADKLLRRARHQGRTPANLMRRLIEEGLNRLDKAEPRRKPVP